MSTCPRVRVSACPRVHLSAIRRLFPDLQTDRLATTKCLLLGAGVDDCERLLSAPNQSKPPERSRVETCTAMCQCRSCVSCSRLGFALTRCACAGAGTLGCAVARTLLGWGVRHITLVDSGAPPRATAPPHHIAPHRANAPVAVSYTQQTHAHEHALSLYALLTRAPAPTLPPNLLLLTIQSGAVSFSNPVRQWLFNLEDCVDGGKPKAEAAAAALTRIFPGCKTEGVRLSVPMPGHFVPSADEAAGLADAERLEALVRDHDVVFLLTDTRCRPPPPLPFTRGHPSLASLTAAHTCVSHLRSHLVRPSCRESRWLPTLLCAAHGRTAITAALGFDSYLVMRHGAGVGTEAEADATQSEAKAAPEQRAASAGGGFSGRLGCYFCNDVVRGVARACARAAMRTGEIFCSIPRSVRVFDSDCISRRPM